MTLLAEHVADHHAGPLSHQNFRVGSTHAPGAAADQYHLAVDPSHDRLSYARRHAKLVECAIRHPTANMRYAVLAAIWNHPDSFRQIFQFGLTAPLGLPEIRKIVAEELDKGAPATI